MMSLLRTQFGSAVVGLTMLLAAYGSPHAEEIKPQCHGTDIVAELAAADPQLHTRVIEEAKAAENAEAVLWKVERAGAAPSYLFGTVHLTDGRVTTLSASVKSALAGAETVVLEVADLSPSATSQAISEAAKLVMFTDGRRLDQMLSESEYEKVKSAISRAGMPSEFAALFRPWIVSMMMAVSECERLKVQEGAKVLDAKIAEAARARDVPVYGLETIEDQLGAMAAVPDKDQLEILRASLAFADRSNDIMETMLQLYLNRRMGAAWPLQIALAGKAGIGSDAFNSFQEELVTRRNIKMRDNALGYLQKGNAFIAVGALHLSGKSGVVQLLREAGYAVTAIE